MSTDPALVSRRRFLAATGAVVAGLAATPRARSQNSPSSSQSPPAFRIDVQSHLYPPELLDFMEKRSQGPRVIREGKDRKVIVGNWVRGVLPKHSDPAGKLADMDANGIALAAISINDPGPERFGPDGLRVARMANDYIASVTRAHPGRFIGLMVLPLQDMAASRRELRRCVDELGMKGILLYSNIDGRPIDEPRFRPIFAEAEQANVPILLHPAYPTTFDAVGEQLAGGLGMMFENTIALSRIIMAGILDDCPRLRLLCPHIGGTLPYLIGRLDHQTHVLKRAPATLRRRPSEYLRKIYFDVVNPLPEAVQLMHKLVGPDRLLFASDHPWVDPSVIVNCIEAVSLPDVDRMKLYRENARILFNLA